IQKGRAARRSFPLRRVPLVELRAARGSLPAGFAVCRLAHDVGVVRPVVSVVGVPAAKGDAVLLLADGFDPDQASVRHADDAVQLVRHGNAVVGKVALDAVDVAAELIERLADSVEPGGLLAPEICRPAEQSGGYSWPEKGQ
ncbi:MAG TPA: hypothetical protein PK752_11360, partial [Accumulibacter sp.]|uniref:hypothetical protein n=1 Tax=Accumulibacter sp. TaxID=2053492 RepID=UPI002C84FB08